METKKETDNIETHEAEPDYNSRHCVVCRKRITRLSFTGWVHK